MAELKKCPFCGSGVAKIKVGSPFMWEHAIECADCGASTKLIGAITPSMARKRAIEAWNNRATEAEIRAKAYEKFSIEAVRQFIEFDEEHDFISIGVCLDIMAKVAEQLKEG